MWVLLLLGLAAQAQTDPLAGLRATLEGLRSQRNQHQETRGATTQLTVAKHQLRDWVEGRLSRFTPAEDEYALTRELQDSLAGLRCPGGCVTSGLGFVDPVRFRRDGEFLTVQTSVGIGCGYDDSAYIYQWRKNGSKVGWQRIFETEQNVYTKAAYRPQTIYSVQVSAPDIDGDRLILTLGSRPGCSGAFQPMFYRIWRMKNTKTTATKPKLLLDAGETIYVGDYPPAKGTLSASDVRIEFTSGGTGYGLSHEAVRHFEVDGNNVKQVDPIAPTPRDFVEEWLSAAWKESAGHSEESPQAPSLETWHQKLHRGDGVGDFPDPPLQCSKDPELWQIGIRLHGVATETFYLVRWRQPDRFTMAAIAEHPLCDR